MAHHDTAHRRSPLDDRCTRHQFEAAIDRCRQCGHPFCGECLVYSFGEKQPPFCIPCALSASGVRSNAARVPAMPKKELKKRQREVERARERAAVAEQTTTQIDWSLPFDGSDPTEGEGFPSFDDQPNAAPAPPSPAPPNSGGRPKGGLFGRKKNKVVPF
jgi:hypothetical protein